MEDLENYVEGSNNPTESLSSTAPDGVREKMIEAATWALCKDAGGAGRSKCSAGGCKACREDAELCIDAALTESATTADKAISS